MQVVVGEAAAHQHRDGDGRQIGNQGLPELVAQWMLVALGDDVVTLPGGAPNPGGPEPDESLLPNAAGEREIAVDVGEPSHGMMALRAGGRRAATAYWLMARYDTPDIVTRPSLHGWAAHHCTMS